MTTHRRSIFLKRISIGLALVAIIAAAIWLIPRLIRAAPPAATSQIFVPADSSGFTHVTGPIPLSFPADHGAHPAYQTEWWYYTGNLAAADGHRFGYQLTFFRRALAPPQETPSRASEWATSQVYLAHFALTDVARQDYLAQSKLSRGAAGLAGVDADPFKVWLEDWSAFATDPGTWHLAAAGGDRAIDLTLDDAKGPILQGDGGYSRKGAQPGNASIYYSLTHLVTTGKVTSAGETYDVTGLSWMDREFSTRAIAPNQVGWDWFALQLDNDTELMFYDLRHDDGSIDPYSSGTLIAPGGATTRLALSDFHIESSATWTSPHTGAIYPARWHVTIPSQDITLDIEPLVPDQELNGALTYWEGAVRIKGTHGGKPVSGYGYIELTGYSGPVTGLF